MGNQPSSGGPPSVDEELWTACRCGNSALAATLILDYGAKLTYTDKDYGATPLMVACVFGYINTAAMLIQQGANINAVAKVGKVKNFGKRTPLHFACLSTNPSSVEMVKMMLYWGADPSMVDEHGDTAIDLARDNQMSPVIIDMLEQKIAVISRELGYLDLGASRPTYKEGHARILPVMIEKGDTSGAYYHDMVWYAAGDDQPLCMLLKEATVHIERGGHMRVNSHWVTTGNYNIVISFPGDRGSFTFSVHDEADAVALSQSIRALCGTFRKPAPKAATDPATSSRRTPVTASAKRPASVEPPRARGVSAPRAASLWTTAPPKKPAPRRTSTAPANRRAASPATRRRSIAPAAAPKPGRASLVAAKTVSFLRRLSGTSLDKPEEETRPSMGGDHIRSILKRQLSEEEHEEYVQQVATQARDYYVNGPSSRVSMREITYFEDDAGGPPERVSLYRQLSVEEFAKYEDESQDDRIYFYVREPEPRARSFRRWKK